MSNNDRHLDIEQGAMGSVFRRMTLASLGLDAMEDVSEQSFEVVERADSFAERLLGGMSNVMPKLQTERLEGKASGWAEHIFEGMAGLNGPKSATDLGDWQYWLDAALLMIFDEEDEASESGYRASAVKTNASAVTREAIRERVASLQKSGIKPAMLQSMSPSLKRSFISKVTEIKSKTKTSEIGDKFSGDTDVRSIQSLEIAKTLVETLEAEARNVKAGQRFAAAQAVFANNSSQNFVSHISDKVSSISADLSGRTFAKTEDARAVEQWTKAVSSLHRDGRVEVSSVREMLTSLRTLEENGAVSHVQAETLRSAGQSFVRHLFAQEVSQDVTAIASRIEKMAERVAGVSQAEISSSRALTLGGISGVENGDILQRSLTALNANLSKLTEAVSSKVLASGDTASTLRWQRAADRFVRMQGISDDVDRVLLRDVVESASELSSSGIIPQSLINSVISSPVQKSILTNEPVNKAASFGTKAEADSYIQSAASRVLSQVSGYVKRSVDNLIGDIEQSGITVKGLESFISDIRHTASQSQIQSGNRELSIFETSSVIDELSTKLEQFAQYTAKAVVSQGYDELTSDAPLFVSPEKDTDASADINAVGSIQMLRAALQNAQRTAQEQVKAFAQKNSERTQSADSQRSLFASLAAADSFEKLIAAQNALKNEISSEQNAHLQRLIETVRTSEAHIAEVSRQMSIVEDALSISRGLKNVIRQKGASSFSSDMSVMLGSMQVNGSYLPALNQSLVSYAQIKNELAKASSSSSSYLTGMNAGRLERMLSIVEPANQSEYRKGHRASSASKTEHDTVSHADMQMVHSAVYSEAEQQAFIRAAQASAEARENIVRNVSNMDSVGQAISERLNRSLNGSDSTFVGYDEIVPESFNLIQNTPAKDAQIASERYYPSQKSGDTLSAMFGNRKAISLYASDFASGRTLNAASLGHAIQKWAAGTHSEASFDTYTVNDSGEQVKVSVGLTKTQNAADNAYRVRGSVGETYQPSSARNGVQNQVNASINIEKLAAGKTISGAEEFTPVIAGANYSSNASEYADSQENRSLVSAGTHSLAGILSQLGIHVGSTHASKNAGVSLNVGGVDFQMSPNAFVDIVARPSMNLASLLAPSLVNADNTVFAGYASMVGAQGERRSLKSLRKAYVDAVSKSGAQSAHAEIGFNTQSFAKILGASDSVKQSLMGSYENSVVRSIVSSHDNAVTAASSSIAEDSLADTLISDYSSVENMSAAGDVDYSWVANAANVRLDAAREIAEDASSSASNRQVLSRIDDMLDYVEGKSTRDVGVFSSAEDAARVLLDALPAEGELGNKGLPKWRQKDTHASRVAEARSLREALAKIGASPVQGTQRFNERRYVSPNLMEQSAQAAPLFSGGSSASGSSGSSASSMRSGSDGVASSRIPDEDLQYLAEQIYEKIVENLEEESQRRRNE